MGKSRNQALQEIIAELVQTNGVAHCYDRYCNDDDWTYCIFCEEGDFDPHKKPGWKHKPDCLLVKTRALLDEMSQEAKG